MNDITISTTATLAPFPKTTWNWYVFGGRGTPWVPMLVTLVDHPPLWHRVLTRVFLRSQWERV